MIRKCLQYGNGEKPFPYHLANSFKNINCNRSLSNKYWHVYEFLKMMPYLLLFCFNMKLLLFFLTAGPVIMSIEEKIEADGRSIYVGNVRVTLLLFDWL